MTYKSYVPELNLLREDSGRVVLTQSDSRYKKRKIRSSFCCSEFLRDLFGTDIEVREKFYVITLNYHNIVSSYFCAGIGGITSVVVEPMIIGKVAMDTLSKKIIIAHNHPSGMLKPSDADRNITKQIKQICDILGVELLDHVILTKENYVSFRDEGLL